MSSSQSGSNSEIPTSFVWTRRGQIPASDSKNDASAESMGQWSSAVGHIQDVEEIPRPKSKDGIFPFLSLPAEIRVRIYEFMLCPYSYLSPTLEQSSSMDYARRQQRDAQGRLLGRPREYMTGRSPRITKVMYGHPVTKNDKTHLEDESARYVVRILLVCRRINTEALPIFFSKNHFLFQGHDLRSLVRFIMGSGRERCSRLRHVSFDTQPASDKITSQNTSINITAIIRLRSGTPERNPWNQAGQRRMMIRSLWEYTRPKGVLLPDNHPPHQLSVWEGDDLVRIKEDAWSVEEIVSNGAREWPEAPWWITLGYVEEPTAYELLK